MYVAAHDGRPVVDLRRAGGGERDRARRNGDRRGIGHGEVAGHGDCAPNRVRARVRDAGGVAVHANPTGGRDSPESLPPSTEADPSVTPPSETRAYSTVASAIPSASTTDTPCAAPSYLPDQPVTDTSSSVNGTSRPVTTNTAVSTAPATPFVYVVYVSVYRPFLPTFPSYAPRLPAPRRAECRPARASPWRLRRRATGSNGATSPFRPTDCALPRSRVDDHLPVRCRRNDTPSPMCHERDARQHRQAKQAFRHAKSHLNLPLSSFEK